MAHPSLALEIIHPNIRKIPKKLLKIKDNLKEIRYKNVIQDGYSLVYYSKNHYVYFLSEDNEIVYVGETKDIYTRPFSHRHNKNFNYVYFLEFKDRFRAKIVEKYWQIKILPKYCNDHYLFKLKENKYKKVIAYQIKLEKLHEKNWDIILDNLQFNFLTPERYLEKKANIQYKGEEDDSSK